MVVLKQVPPWKALYQFAVGFQKVVLRQAGTRHPLDGFKHQVANLAAKFCYGEEDHFHIAVGIAVAQAENLRANFRLNGQFLFQFPPQRCGQTLSILYFATGKFPLQAVGVGAPPLANQNTVSPYVGCRRRPGWVSALSSRNLIVAEDGEP